MSKITKYGVKKFKLKNFNHPLDYAIKQTLTEEKAAKEALDKWLKNNKDFENEKQIELWETSAKDWSSKLLNLTIEVLSASDGINQTNETLRHGLGLKDVSIDTNQFTSLLVKMFRIKLIKLLTENLDLDSNSKEIILDCFIKREFPPKQEKPVIFDRDMFSKPNNIAGDYNGFKDKKVKEER